MARQTCRSCRSCLPIMPNSDTVLLFSACKDIRTQTELETWTPEGQQLSTSLCSIMEQLPGKVAVNPQSPCQQWKQNIWHYQMRQRNSNGSALCSQNSATPIRTNRRTIYPPFSSLIIRAQ